MQSFLAQLETGTTQLPGLSQFPSSAWPPLVVYYLFFTMVVGGLLLAAFSLVYVLGWIFKKRPFESRPMSYTLMIMGLLAFLIYEIGWVIDEVGRQPWIVYNVMTVSQGANYTSSLFVPGILIIIFYVFLVPATFYFFARVFNAKPVKEELEEDWTVNGGVNY
jgi:cytochrome d ubiquinol oxidase subunit I